jgi:uncharacterized membrane protein HdeD (DUF308 family)
MLQVLSKYWWAFALRGLLAGLFGLLALFVPGWQSWSFARMFCMYAILEGLLAIVPSLSSAAEKIWWILLFEGMTSLVLGVFSFLGPGGIGSALWPDVSAFMALVLIGFWALATGILKGIEALRLPKEAAGRWALGWGGGVSVLLGVVIFAVRPGEGVLAMSRQIGLCGLVLGALLIFLGLKARGKNANGAAGQLSTQ